MPESELTTFAGWDDELYTAADWTIRLLLLYVNFGSPGNHVEESGSGYGALSHANGTQTTFSVSVTGAFGTPTKIIT